MQLPRHPVCRRRLAGQRGQDTIEWAGVLLVVAAIIAAVVSFAPSLGTTVGHDVECEIAKIFGGGCPAAPGYRVSVSARTMGYNPRASAGISAGRGALGVRAVERTLASSPPRAVAAITGPSANQIIHGLGLDVLGKTAVAAARRIASQNAAGSITFSQVLQALGKFVGKDSILGLLASFGFDDGDLSCEQGPLYMRAQPTFALVANVLDLVSRAQPGPNRPLFTKILDAQSALNKLKTFILKDNKVVSQCEGPNRVALATINMLYPALAAAEAHLKALSVNLPPLAERLPKGGERPYVPPKSSHGQPKPAGPRSFEDSQGNIWEWDPSGHAGPHWDVHHPGRRRRYTKVSPTGHVIGKDNFPNKPPRRRR